MTRHTCTENAEAAFEPPVALEVGPKELTKVSSFGVFFSCPTRSDLCVTHREDKRLELTKCCKNTGHRAAAQVLHSTFYLLKLVHQLFRNELAIQLK